MHRLRVSIARLRLRRLIVVDVLEGLAVASHNHGAGRLSGGRAAHAARDDGADDDDQGDDNDDRDEASAEPDGGACSSAEREAAGYVGGAIAAEVVPVAEGAST